MTFQYLHEQYLIRKRGLIRKGWLPKRYPFHMMGRKDVIFLHIPKTAGTSIRETLLFYPPFRGINQYDQHHTTRQILYLIGKERWEACFTFCFVRNPWERLLSQHRYFVRKGVIDGKHREFEYWAKKKINNALENDPLKRQNRHFYPASDWMKDKHGHFIEPDFIGRFEYVERDFSLICKQLNWNASLKQMNIAPQKIDFRKAYNDDLRVLVTLFFKEDIERFGYQFE